MCVGVGEGRGEREGGKKFVITLSSGHFKSTIPSLHYPGSEVGQPHAVYLHQTYQIKAVTEDQLLILCFVD